MLVRALVEKKKILENLYLGMSVTIQNAILLSKRSDMPRFLKVTFNSVQGKVTILKNKLKLRSSNNLTPVRNVFITPNFTSLEQKKNKALHLQLVDMRMFLYHKKWEDSA